MRTVVFVLWVSFASSTKVSVMADSTLVSKANDAHLTVRALAKRPITENTTMNLGMNWHFGESTIDWCKAVARVICVGGFDTPPAKIPIGTS